MATQSTASYLEQLLENQYVQDNFREAAENLRDAYRRASKRRVEPASDEKVRRQIRQAIVSASEAGQALRSGRTKPKRRRATRLLVLAGVGAVGAAVAFAASDELRELVFGEPDEPSASEGGS